MGGHFDECFVVMRIILLVLVEVVLVVIVYLSNLQWYLDPVTVASV